MPQFQFTSAILWSQVLWLAIFFAILYFGIVKLTLPKLGRVMQARDDQVSGDLGSAESAKAEADRMAAEYDAGVAAAQDAARAKLTDARSAATVALEAKLKASNEVIEKQAADAQASLDSARTSALSQVEGVSADAAADIVERLTGKRPADAAAAKAAQAALA